MDRDYVNKAYGKFQELFKKDLDIAAKYLIDNPQVKNELTKSELITIVNYYENKGFYESVISLLRKANKDVVEANSRLEKTLKELEEKK